MKNHISLNKTLFYAVWLCLCFALSFPVTASAQDVKVSINVSQQPLETVLTLLEQQSGYHFFYNNDQVSGKTPVTINVKDEPLSAVLKKILPERNLTYSVVRQQIILSNVNRAVSAGKIIVRGRVTDTEAARTRQFLQMRRQSARAALPIVGAHRVAQAQLPPAAVLRRSHFRLIVRTDISNDCTDIPKECPIPI